MGSESTLKKKENLWIPLLCLAVLCAAAAAGFDYTYDLNDDVLIAHILSGVYTGRPEAMTAQLLYPLGVVLAGLYTLLPRVPVFGIFLWLCQMGSLYLIMVRSLKAYVRTTPQKWALAIAETFAFWGLLGYHLIFVQYSVATGLLMAAAVCWLFTEGSAGERSFGQYLKQNVPALLLAILAVLLRSEMAILMLPYACLAGLWLWMQEKKFFTKDNWIRYGGFFLTVVLVMGLLMGVDKVALKAAGYDDFTRFFDARTTVYDYHSADLRSYEKQKAFYDELGLSRTQTEMLANYNFGACDAIDTAVMEAVAAYGDAIEGRLQHSLREGLWLYEKRLANDTSLGMHEMPYLAVLLGLVVLLLLYAVRNHQPVILWKLVFWFCGRSVLWMYLILAERVPDRIAHPMYFMEILLLALLLAEALKTERKGLSVRYAAIPILAVLVLSSLPGTTKQVLEETAKRRDVNSLHQEAVGYYRAHPDTWYLADVMSTVQFSEGLFSVPARGGNYDLLGGWLCRSPLQLRKLHQVEKAREGAVVDSCEELLRAAVVNPAWEVCLVGEPECDWTWLQDYFAEQGLDLTLEQETTLETAGGALEIYAIREGR